MPDETLQRQMKHLWQNHRAVLQTLYPSSSSSDQKETEYPVQRLIWAEPGRHMYSITYLLHRGHLFVSGDYYEALYRWSGDISFEFLAGCDLGYFAEKCKSPPIGGKYCWDMAKAQSIFAEELCAPGGALEDMPDEIRKEARDSLYSESEWQKFLSANTSEDWMPYLSKESSELISPGKVLNSYIEIHLLGIRMAMALREKDD